MGGLIGRKGGNQKNLSVKSPYLLLRSPDRAAARPDRSARPGEASAGRSGRFGELVDLLDIGHDVRGLPDRVGSDRSHADGPIAAPVPAGHAAAVELHAPAKRLALQPICAPRPDLVN